MPRQLRIQYPGAMYHVMSRGNRRQDIFLDDVDRLDSLKTLAEARQKTDWQIHAYCLMRNHYHLVVETPNADMVAGMTWLQSTYTIRLNHRHKLIGHVLSGRYKAQLVEGSGNGYLRTACDYVHLNPVRAGLLQPEERLPTPGAVLATTWRCPNTGRTGLEWTGCWASTACPQTMARLNRSLNAAWRRGAWSPATRRALKRYGAAGAARAKAERIIAGELGRLGWRETDLAARRKHDPDKIQLAQRLREETTNLAAPADRADGRKAPLEP